jgi:D-amino-acid oxidase
MSASTQKALVLGAGAVGLRTALELVANNIQVVLRAPRHPLHPSTCSMGAGGLWMPFHCDDPRVDRWSIETLDELLHIEQKKAANQQQSTQRLVETIPAVCLWRNHYGPTVDEFAKHNNYVHGQPTRTSILPQWTQDVRLKFQHMTVEMLTWQNLVYKMRIPSQADLVRAGYMHAWLFQTPIVNTPAMLEHMLAKLVSMQVDVNVETGRVYESIDQVCRDAKELGCDTVVNCTGLGSRDLMQDNSIVGARGILLKLDRASCTRLPSITGSLSDNVDDEGDVGQDVVITAEEEPWGTANYPCYMIPRGDTIVVGGSYIEGDYRQEITDQERKQLVQNAELMGIDMSKAKITGEWVGFRPVRPQVRCEIDARYTGGVRVVHNYGMGGSGWTVNVGAAKECVRLLLQDSQ